MRRHAPVVLVVLSAGLACEQEDNGGDDNAASETSGTSTGEGEVSGVPGGAEHDTGCIDACDDDPAELRCAAVLDCMWNESCQEEVVALRECQGTYPCLDYAYDALEDCARDCVVGYRPTDVGDPKPNSGDFACPLPPLPPDGCNAVWDVAWPKLRYCAERSNCEAPDFEADCKGW